MRISKTLFKNLMRCPNFGAIYDMYLNRGAHNVKNIDGSEVHQIIDSLENMGDVVFTEMDEDVREIFSSLFDEETGEDLTETTNAQLEAFSEVYVEVERLAMEYVKTVFNHDLIASVNTLEQQHFEYTEHDHLLYCYLDGYMEDDDYTRVFEVKSTTSRKYDDFKLKIRPTKAGSGASLPLFVKNNRGIYEYVGNEYLNTMQGGKVVTAEMLNEKVKRLLDPYSPEGKYIYDLAIERHIIENSLRTTNQEYIIPKMRYYLVVLNCEYTFDGARDESGYIYRTDNDGNALFKIYDMTYITSLLEDDVLAKRNRIEYYLNNLDYKHNRCGNHCEYKKTTQCKFFPVCFKRAIKDGSILEYLNKHYAFKSLAMDTKGNRATISLYDLINEEKYGIEDVRDYIVKIDNIMQYDCYVNNMIYTDLPRIRKAINSIQYPIYHLDFESYNSPLPRFFGEKPFMQSLFQYSLHIEEYPGVCDIVKDHHEYLAPDHEDHREDLIKALINDIDLSKGGIVMVYNQNFEKTRLHEMARIFPKYKKQLDKINDHIYDLYAVLRGVSSFYEPLLNEAEIEDLKNKPSFTYYNNKLHGSFSIKKVLPIFTNLSYKDLTVKNGTEAILTYGMLPKLTDKEYNDMYLALRVYCRQDTWAMVEILRGLRKLIKA